MSNKDYHYNARHYGDVIVRASIENDEQLPVATLLAANRTGTFTIFSVKNSRPVDNWFTGKSLADKVALARALSNDVGESIRLIELEIKDKRPLRQLEDDADRGLIADLHYLDYRRAQLKELRLILSAWDVQ